MFEDFARAGFKVGERYAQQARAVLNNEPGLMDRAREDLQSAYKEFQQRDEAKNAEKNARDFVSKFPDIERQLNRGHISLEQANTLAQQEKRERDAQHEAERNRRQTIINKILGLCDSCESQTIEAREIIEWIAEEDSALAVRVEPMMGKNRIRPSLKTAAKLLGDLSSII